MPPRFWVDVLSFDRLADLTMPLSGLLESDDRLEQRGLPTPLGPMTPTMPLRGSVERQGP